MSYVRISTGRVDLKTREEINIITDKVIGKIEKVIIKYDENCTEETRITIITSDGEIILDVTGNKNGIYYPRNWNVMNQKYTGVNVASETTTTPNERYVSDGSLVIILTGGWQDDIIEDIELLIDGEIKPVEKNIEKLNIMELQKVDSPVTSTTTGVSNPLHSRRRRLEKYMMQVLKGILAEEKKGMDIEKQNEGIKDMSKFIEDNLFDRKFEGIGKVVSDRIKSYMIVALKNGYPIERITTYIQDKSGLEKLKAEVIARTEIQALQNAVREWSYKKIDPEDKFNYKWIGPQDNRTTEICQNIKSKTGNGVSLSKLREIVKEESIKGGFDGSREWTPHISCRHTYVRTFK